MNDEKKIEILMPDELLKLFPADWETVWESRTDYLLHRLASISGMRFGELLGLRGEYVHENYVEVCAQFTRYGNGDTKTHKTKYIPLPKSLRDELQYLIDKNGVGYVFSRNGGKSPFSRQTLYRRFYAVLEKIGIDERERMRRNLSVHGWRHFLSTELEMNDIPDARAREVTGHTSRESRKRYNHIDNLRMLDVIKVQEQLVSNGIQQGGNNDIL